MTNWTQRAAIGATTIGLLALPVEAGFVSLSAIGDGQVTSRTGTEEIYSFLLDVTDQTGGYDFTSIEAEIIRTFTPGGESDLISGTFSFLGAAPGALLELSYDGSYIDSGMTLKESVMQGAWSTVTGQGPYASLSGTGGFAGTALFFDTTFGRAWIEFEGNLVPAPGAAALLGLLTVARRRRR